MSEDGWIPHDGNECPVGDEDLVEVQYRAQPDMPYHVRPRYVRWNHRKGVDGARGDGDIIAYRILSQGDTSNG